MNHQTRLQADRIFDAATEGFKLPPGWPVAQAGEALFAHGLQRISLVAAGLASPEERERKRARVVLSKILRRGGK